jgi:hypothetical protein
MATFDKRKLDGTWTNQMDIAFKENTYMIAIQGLKTMRPELFAQKNKDKSKQWKVATWSCKIRGY